MPSRSVLNLLVGFVVGTTGGLVGLGGAELRLPYFIGPLGLSPHQAVRVNLAISLFTIAAAIPVRFVASPPPTSAHLPEALAIAIGAVIAAYLGAAWLHRISSVVLARLISVLLAILGVGLLIEAVVEFQADGLLPDSMAIRIGGGLLFGFAIGAISSLLGVAGGEVIIPTLVLGFGAPIKVAGSLSLLISLPTVVTGLARHIRSEFLSDRTMLMNLILPMGLGSVAGAAAGGLMVGIAPESMLKIGLGLLLIWSARKVFAKGGTQV